MIRPVAVVATAQTELRPDPERLAPDMIFDVAKRAVAASGLSRDEIPLCVSASSDMLEGRPFNFVKGLEAVGAWPAIHESHVEMDGAWAAYEAWIALQTGELDAALVFAWSKASEASLHAVTNTRLDPFYLAPLGLDDDICAALQADACGFAGGSSPVPVVDGACAVVLAAGNSVRSDRPVWIRAADHRAEPGALGARDLSRSESAARAMARVREIAAWDGRPDAAELHATYAHQRGLLTDALGLPESVDVRTPVADPMMATGLIRIAEAAERIRGTAATAVAHAATGPAMQQNAVFLLEALA